ncbi:protein-lysine N-methyltransferase EEF2KMT [Chenopodium quinoa]|uniref:FAM86 N-terminal domain-containing protein n=1 Tax=Chenopodium quinoa TaxID=63459 RepID=A0A803KPB2_CHEQI|nr:protein-lysine N-methyltransferase EEF2KMT [Chenopodium quinoa]
MPNHYWEFDMGNLDLNKLYLVSAFLAMEPSDSLISLARRCGGGFISEEVQQFIWDYCINKFDENLHVPYLKLFLKKLIKEIELTGSNVLDEFYERYAHYMVSLKEDASEKAWIVKCISFIFHDIPSYPGEMQMVVPLQCSLNMLQGDTGCALWPSCLFLSEFVLSFPEVFTRKSCFEVGSGVGLLGVCLNHVNASQVILSDGDASSLANLKINLEMNKIENPEASLDKSTDSSYMVQCIHLPWESAKESELQQIKSDIVLGADVIYDPSCLPHLVQVLSIFLNRRKTSDSKLNGSARVDNKEEDCLGDDSTESNTATLQEATLRTLIKEMDIGPVAIIASVIRNIDTFNCFLNLCCQNNLLVRDITKSIRPYNLLPYMESYKRSDVHLLVLSYVS